MENAEAMTVEIVEEVERLGLITVEIVEGVERLGLMTVEIVEEVERFGLSTVETVEDMENVELASGRPGQASVRGVPSVLPGEERPVSRGSAWPAGMRALRDEPRPECARAVRLAGSASRPIGLAAGGQSPPPGRSVRPAVIQVPFGFMSQILDPVIGPTRP